MTHSLTDAVAAYFRAHPNELVPMQTLAGIAGLGGWRTRVSNARMSYGMRIENKTARVKRADGSTITTSHYRFCPASLLEMAEAS